MIQNKKNLIALFCYGSNNNEQVRLRVNNNKIISRPCTLPFYRRIFAGNVQGWNGGVASIVHINNEKTECRGAYVLLTEEEMKRMDKCEGTISDNPFDNNPLKNFYRRQNVKIRLLDGKLLDAIAYIKNDNTWVSYPSEQYLNACYNNIKPFWSDLDGNHSLMVYDVKGTLHGKYVKK
jgi:hypothetical protein